MTYESYSFFFTRTFSSCAVMDKMKFEEDGSLVVKFSSKPEVGNWLYTPGGKMVILIRAYQADPEKIGDYVPPAFKLKK